MAHLSAQGIQQTPGRVEGPPTLHQPNDAATAPPRTKSLYRLSRLRSLGTDARSHTVSSSSSRVCATACSPP